MAFNRNPLDSFAGIGQFGADQLAWNPQYSVSGRKAAPELSPGARKNIGLIGMQAKQKKSNFYLDDEDSEASMYFNNQSIFQPQKEMITSPSPSQLSAFSSNLYSQSSGFGNIAIQQRNMNSQQFQRPSSSIPGHVTPTSGGMVPNFPSSLPQQQASPNRNMLPLSSRGVLGQPQLSQSINNMKRNVSIPSSLVTSSNQLSGMSQFGLSQNRGFSGSQGIVGGGADNSSVTLDLSDFPSLTSRGRHDNTSSSSALGTNPMAGKTAYVGMVKQPNSESSQEFQIHNEDFPALPGSQNQDSSREDASRKTPVSSVFAAGGTKQQLQKPGIQTAADGMVTNIPAGMVTDQFGMVGLLTFIRATETDPNLVSLALGSDLTTLGLNLNSPENLYPNFGGPWAETPCRPQDIDFHVPQEYLTNMKIRDKLAPIKLNRYGEDLLFYMFYTNGGDVLQLAAAAELYNRDWRYHKEERVWITRSPGMVPVEKTNTYERGTYFFFDAQNWRKVAKEFHLDYDKLEDRPHLPPSLLPSPAQGAIMA